MLFHVCAGLGTNPYMPVRFACRPEAIAAHARRRAEGPTAAAGTDRAATGMLGRLPSSTAAPGCGAAW